jgi:cell division protein FtsQ
MRWIVPVGIVGGLVGLVYLSPVFAVRVGDIEVLGRGGWIDPAAVSETLSRDVGVPLARLDTGATEARLEAMPGVADAKVRRNWPTGLIVELTPRVAAAAVADGAGYVLLDVDATPVASVAEAPEGLPVIEVPLTAGNERTVGAVLRVVSSLPQSLSRSVATIGGATEDTVTFTLISGVQIIWGSADAAAVKAAAVEILLKQPDVTSIDVSAPESPVVR